jgi:hypothetical protein
MNHNQRQCGRFTRRSLGIGQCVILGTISLPVAAPFALATDTWTDTSDNWTVPGDWSSGVPASGDDASIADSDGVSRTINYDYSGVPATLNSLTIDLTGGTGTAANTLLIAGNNLTAASEVIGNNGSGAITQTGGINTINTQGFVGNNNGSTGIYNLSGTGVLVDNGFLSIGAGTSANGTVNQSGGTATMTNTGDGVTLILGEVHGVGSYNLSGGSLTSYAETVGVHGRGSFTQTGGTNTLTLSNDSYVALGVGGSSGAVTGTYNLSGSGVLNSPNETIYPAGVFTQGGGSNTISALSHQVAEFEVAGAYNLSGGLLTADALSDNGNFNQSGGHATFAQVGTGFVQGSVAITGGEMSLVPDGFSSPASTINRFSISGTGVLNLVLGGYSQGVNYDLIKSYGTISLGGTLDIDLADGFVPGVGDQFTVISQASGSINGTFNQLASDDPGLAYSVNYGPSDNMVQVTITSVPEPGTIALLTAATGLLLLRRRPRLERHEKVSQLAASV